ncbi:MAG: hypothetical protein RL021_17 [Bacteroidota bacterium]
MGSRDRREIRSLVYSHFRLGRSLSHLDFKERLAVAAFLTQPSSDPIKVQLLEFFGWEQNLWEKNLMVRLEAVKDRYMDFRIDELFPFADQLTTHIDREAFIRSMLVQPDVWIRIRENHISKIETEFREKGFSWDVDEVNPAAWAFPAATPLLETEAYKAGYFEIQDYSSQHIGSMLHPRGDEHWWDACAASGGKSLLLLDQEPGIRLTATDVRSSIIRNYQLRLEKAGFKGVDTRVVDLSRVKPFSEGYFDAVLADVPCSGSGTWARTPEMLVFFDSDRVKAFYEPLQRSILETCVYSLKKGGKLIFSTCSVFESENEANTRYMTADLGMQILSESYIFGVPKRADSMYVSVLIKN